MVLDHLCLLYEGIENGQFKKRSKFQEQYKNDVSPFFLHIYEIILTVEKVLVVAV
jgi:hypothetical protein